jgi:hypothetical protein
MAAFQQFLVIDDTLVTLTYFASAKASISRRALMLSIKRKLAAKGQRLASDHRGKYRVIDLAESVIVDENADLAKLAKDLDCIRPWEEARF